MDPSPNQNPCPHWGVRGHCSACERDEARAALADIQKLVDEQKAAVQLANMEKWVWEERWALSDLRALHARIEKHTKGKP